MKRRYVVRVHGNAEWYRAYLTSELNALVASLEVAARDDGAESEIRFTIDWIGVDEWLEDRARRLLQRFPETDDWSVRRIDGFVDLTFPPMPEPCLHPFYEHCRIEGPERYGAIAHYGDGYRFYLGPRDVASNERGFIDIEEALDTCVERVARYIRTGEGRPTVLPRRSHR
jgi:hypothetical protein